MQSVFNVSRHIVVIFSDPDMNSFVLKLLLICTVIHCLEGSGYDDMKILSDKLMTNYSKHIRPRRNQTEMVQVSVEPIINLILRFDESSGVFVWYGSFIMRWSDERIIWNVSEHSGILSVNLPLIDMWVPKFVVGNSANKRTFYIFNGDFDYHTSYVVYQPNGTAFFTVGGTMETSCGANMFYFPADYHMCMIDVHPELEDITFKKHEGYDISQRTIKWFEPSSEWEIINVTTRDMSYEGYSDIKIFFHIQRKPLFVCITLIMPIVLVSLINMFVFVLLIESGERISFSVTLFLTFVIVMEMVAGSLPASSQIGVFTAFLVVRCIISALTTIMTILSNALFYKEEDVDECCLIFKVIEKVFNRTSNRRKERYTDDTNKDEQSTHAVVKDTSWRTVVKNTDILCTKFLKAEMLIELILVLTIFVLRGTNKS